MLNCNRSKKYLASTDFPTTKNVCCRKFNGNDFKYRI